MGREIALLPRHHLLRSFRAGCFVCTTAIAPQPPQCVGGRRGKEKEGVAGDYTWSMLGARTLFWAGLGNTWGGGRCVAGIILPLFAQGSSGERGNSTRAASARWKSLHWLRAVIQHKLISQIKVSPPFGWRKRQGQGHTCTCNKHRPTQS